MPAVFFVTLGVTNQTINNPNMASTKNQKAMYDQVVSILDTVQGNTIPSYQGLYAFWQNPEVFLNASLYGQRLIAPQDGLTTQTTASGCCGSSAPASNTPDKTMSPVKTEGCCGSQETATAPIDSQPKLTSSANLAAPKVTTDCWPSGGSSGGGGDFPTVKRSDQSGIIIGLKS